MKFPYFIAVLMLGALCYFVFEAGRVDGALEVYANGRCK